MQTMTLQGTSGPVSLGAAAGGRLVLLYFYPKDNTPGCSLEAQEFAGLHAEFERAGCVVYGVSRDSVASHTRFRAKLALPFDLLSDPEEVACSRFEVIKMKKLYGKEVRGVERSSFLLDAEGNLVHAWRGVKAAGHAAEVLAFIKALSRNPSA